MKILIVEDDPIVARTLELLILSYNHAVDSAADGEIGLQMVETFEYDLILLDVKLPKLDGISLCQQIRARKFQMLILLLTGQGGTQQKASALNAGADDYVVKPFDSEELMARVQALLRRRHSSHPILTWGNLSLDPSSRRVNYKTYILSSTPKEYAILELLLRNPQTVFSARAILDHAWAATASPGEEAIRVHIKELRKKLVAVGAPKDLIQTVHRVGYRLNPLYSSDLTDQVNRQPTDLQIAELTFVNQELRIALEQPRLIEVELRQKNQELETAYQTIAQDTRDRKQVELQLRETSIVLSDAVEGISRLDKQGCYLTVNEAYASTVGYTVEEMIGMDWRRTVHPDNLEAVIANYYHMLKTGKVELEAKGIRKDGSVFDKQLVMISDYDEQQCFIGHHCFMRDITERKRLEAERLEAEHIIREQAALLDIASDAICVRDLDDRILYWNLGAERLYGWQATEAIGQKAHELLHDDAAQISEIVQILLKQGQWQGELRKVTKTGKDVIVAGRWTLVLDQSGQPKSILTVNTDITEKKSLEAQFYHAQRLESLGTLASGIAHDLNNVLTPVLTIAQLLRFTPVDSERRSQMLQMLEESAKRGADMVQQILTFARGTESNQIPVQITHLLQEVITVMQQTFPRSILIHSNVPSRGIGLIAADPTQLHQVLINLCVNARDAMPKGGEISISVQNCAVDEHFAQLSLDAKVGHYVLVTITDTGVGIPADIRDRIFEPFFTTKAMNQGTGLGLSTTLGIIRSHGGFLHLSSKVGHGTQFRVYLPITS